jgi:hypothetical protein
VPWRVGQAPIETPIAVVAELELHACERVLRDFSD